MADGVVKFEVQYDTSKATTSLDSIKNKAKSVGDSTKTMSKVAGGALAGVIIGTLSYGWLCFFAAVPVLALGLRSLKLR